MKHFLANPGIRRGLRDGLIVSGLIAVDVVWTNVLFPPGADESDSDPEYVVQNLITFAVLAALLILIGARARRRSIDGAGPVTGAKAGASAGAVIGAMATLTYVTVNNVFLDIVSHQHDKRVAFAASGWTSMRAYLTLTQLGGGLFLIPALAAVGALLGLLGALLVRPRAAASRTA